MVRLTDRPDMTLDVYHGRKTTTTTTTINVAKLLLSKDEQKLELRGTKNSPLVYTTGNCKKKTFSLDYSVHIVF